MSDNAVVKPKPTALSVNTSELNRESLALINQIIAEPDEKKTKDLTYLFNLNQNKKNIVRLNKLNDLQDAITDQAVERFTSRPDEISNKELLDGLKTVTDLIERGQNQLTDQDQTPPLIQINQQDNSVNIGKDEKVLSRDSREKVKKVVMGLLKDINSPKKSQQSPKKDTQESDHIIDVETENLLIVDDDEVIIKNDR